MCTSGWIKTNDGAILFKNRDREPGENINSNFLKEREGILMLSDTHFNGCWFGWNGCFAISDTLGPHQEVCPGRVGEKESFRLMEDVLRRTNSVDTAAKLYKKLFLQRKIGMSYNVLIADSERVVILELIHDNVRERVSDTSTVCVNMFKQLKDCNRQGDAESIACSEGRLKTCSAEMSNIHRAEDVLTLLRSHADNERENLCRHGKRNSNSITVASVVLELKSDELLLYHCLNQTPCEGEYEKKQIQLHH